MLKGLISLFKGVLTFKQVLHLGEAHSIKRLVFPHIFALGGHSRVSRNIHTGFLSFSTLFFLSLRLLHNFPVFICLLVRSNNGWVWGVRKLELREGKGILERTIFLS